MITEEKKTTTDPDPPPSFSSLPDEIAENCLARNSKWEYHTSLCLVSKRFHSILSSPKLYTTRSQIKTIEPCFYFCLKLPKYQTPKWFNLLMKPPDDDDDDDIQDEYSLVPIPSYSSLDPHVVLHIPNSSSTVSVGSEIYLLGVPCDDNSSPSTCVRILDCKSHSWRDGPSMNVARAGADAVCLDENIYVIGGCEKGESWMEVFDVKTQTWRILESHGVAEELQRERWFMIHVLGGKIYAIANKKDYVYDPKEGTWDVLETIGSIDAWCVIENVMYCYTRSGYLKWYDSKSREWREVKGFDSEDLEDLREDVICSLKWPYVLEMVNYGGKLLVLWVPRFEEDNAKPKRKIWCAKIALEKNDDEGEIWGKREWTNTVLTVPKSFKFLSCVVVSI